MGALSHKYFDKKKTRMKENIYRQPIRAEKDVLHCVAKQNKTNGEFIYNFYWF